MGDKGCVDDAGLNKAGVFFLESKAVMKRGALGLGLAGLLWLVVACTNDQEPGTVVLQGNGASILEAEVVLQGDGVSILEAELAGRIADLAASMDLRGAPPRDSVRKIAMDTFKTKAMAAEAEARGLDRDPQVIAKLEAARLQVLRDALARSIQDQVEVPDLEAAARDFYDSQPEKFSLPRRARLSHILFKELAETTATAPALRARAEAGYEEILKRIDAGETFADLAREFSQDMGTAPRGGALGDWTTGENLDRRFAAAAFNLQPGQISGLVETRFGFHIIRMDELVPAAQIPFDQVRGQIIKGLKEEYLLRQVAVALQGFDDQVQAAQWNESVLDRLSRPADKQPDQQHQQDQPMQAPDNPAPSRDNP